MMPRQRQAVALVLSLFLVVLMATTVGGVAASAATETVISGWASNSLVHELAVESLVTALPLLRAAERRSGWDANGHSRAFTIAYAGVQVRGLVAAERDKSSVEQGSEDPTKVFNALARENGLSPDAIRLAPLPARGDPDFPQRLVWFDQIIEPRPFGEVFARQSAPGDPRLGEQKVWSDLITFWGRVPDTVLAIQVQTTVGVDERHWYVIAVDHGAHLEILYRIPIWP